jgi:hypothetical protein
LKTSNGTASIGADRAVVAAASERISRNVLKCIPTVDAELQHTAIKAYGRICGRRFEIEIVAEHQLKAAAFETTRDWE